MSRYLPPQRLTLHQQLQKFKEPPKGPLMHAPEPAAVQEGRGRKEFGERLPEREVKDGVLRPFFCRTCGEERVGVRIPEGWYTVNRHNHEAKAVRLGIYCCIECLAEQMPRLLGIARDMQLKAARARSGNP